MSDPRIPLEPSDTIKCRYCEWRTLKWSTTKSGKKRSGWTRLQNHLEDEHDIITDLGGDLPDA